MKLTFRSLFSVFSFFTSAVLIIGSSGCANIIPPGGGPRDSLPPVLVSALPKDSAIHFNSNRITLDFDEFVEIDNAFENVLVSPLPNNVPNIIAHLRTVNIRLKDTLEANTTYSINFGNGLKDINEGNIAKNFTYVFSTGSRLDLDSVVGKVTLAETGKVDSTLIVVLHRNLADTAVEKDKPRYMAKVDGQGNFAFHNLPAGTFAIYAIPNDFSRHYDDTTKPFAFADSAINTTRTTPVILYAYTLAKTDTAKAPAKAQATNTKDRKKQEKQQLRFQTNLESARQDLLSNLEITFAHPIKTFDTTKIILADTNYTPVSNYTVVADTNKTSFSIVHTWPANTPFKLLIDKTAFSDSTGVTLAKNDTLRFTTKGEEDYGSLKIRFKNLDLTKNPVLQILQNDKILSSTPLTTPEWFRQLYVPGDYDLRILYDDNKNGKWDPGKFFGVHKQPEIVVPINAKINVRGNWDNQKDIVL